MPSRRSFIGIPLAAFALNPFSLLRAAEVSGDNTGACFASPPVVQNPSPEGCAFTFRVSGPVAPVGLDAGEDRPDHHPVFAGMAAYEEHRRRQAEWLKAAVQEPDIASASYKVVLCHIPLRSADKDDNDGRSLEGYADHSDEGLDLWGPILRAAGFRLIISGHTHQWRIQDADATETLMQAVGGGPRSDNAVIIYLDADDK
jgi:acid phosphatase type 7